MATHVFLLCSNTSKWKLLMEKATHDYLSGPCEQSIISFESYHAWSNKCIIPYLSLNSIDFFLLLFVSAIVFVC